MASLKSILSTFKAVALAAAAASPPSPSSISSGITLLYNNDLELATAPFQKSALLVDQKSYSSAVSACNALGETLLPVNNTFFTTDLASLLRYQAFLGNYPETQQFWVASHGSTCQVVNVQGHVSSSSCARNLPTLCSQSAAFAASAAPSTQLSVSGNGLTVTGFRDQLSFRFLGVPFADPPARWTYPTPYMGPSEINATQAGAECAQAGIPTSSEDCLFLNIFTPFIPSSSAVSPKKLKPVFFWIHGGGYTSGTGSDPTFDGGNMASRGDVVVVTSNYRLSTIGFLALEDGKTNGNYGIADHIAALDWVREHIAAFGGDSERITIFGQSAGAASVRALLGSPKAIGKYAAAIPMSNLAGDDYSTTFSLYYTIEQLQSVAVEPILRETRCDSTDALACLAAVDAQTLVNLPDFARYIVVDGTFITSSGLPLNGSGPVAHVPTMMGFMRDDYAAILGALVGFPTSGNLTAELIAASVPTTVANNPLFPEPSSPNATLNVFNVTARATTDMGFRCLNQATAFSAVKYDLFESIYFYEFNRSYQTPNFDPNYPVCEAPVDADHPLGDTEQEYFKCHSGELFYVFGNMPADRPYRDDKDLPFMQQMVDVWTSFARTYDPNPDPAYLAARGYTNVAEELAKQSKWTPVTAETVKTTPLRQLMWPSFMTGFKEQEQCDFFGFPLDYFG